MGKKTEKRVAKGKTASPEVVEKKTRGFDEATKGSILKDYADGMTYVGLAGKYNSSRGSVYTVIAKNGGVTRRPRNK